MLGYVTAALAFVHGVRQAREASVFCHFEKLPSAISLHFSSQNTVKVVFFFRYAYNGVLLHICLKILKRWITVCLSDEVMSFF